MTRKIERLADRNGARIAALLREVVKACREEGLRSPKLFFEPESAAIFVMDGDHPGEVHSDTASLGGRQEAVVARIPVGALGCPFSAGGW